MGSQDSDLSLGDRKRSDSGWFISQLLLSHKKEESWHMLLFIANKKSHMRV